jgi:hypothetical protein
MRAKIIIPGKIMSTNVLGCCTRCEAVFEVNQAEVAPIAFNTDLVGTYDCPTKNCGSRVLIPNPDTDEGKALRDRVGEYEHRNRFRRDPPQ